MRSAPRLTRGMRVRWCCGFRFLRLREGKALAIWLELSEEQQGDYKTAKEKLNCKMMPMGFASLEEFHKRKLNPGKPLPWFM